MSNDHEKTIISEESPYQWEKMDPIDTTKTSIGDMVELKSRFSVLAAIGIQYSITATPLAVGGYLTFIVGLGGSPYFLYAYCVSAFGQFLICLSLAEIAAVYPHASGQVFWTAALADEKWSRILSYWNGASTSLAWIFANAGTYVFAGKMLLGAMATRYPEYSPENYQVFLVTVGCASVGVLFNTLLFDWYPRISKFLVYFINAATLYVMVALLVRATPKASAHQVFVQVINESGWSSNGLVFCLGFLPGAVAVCCFDTAAHMAEEMDHPEKQVPQVMIGGTLLCALAAIPMIIVFLFCTVNPNALLNPVGGQPVFQVFVDGFRSEGLLIVALIIYSVLFSTSCIGTIATGSRLIWSFAKQGGLPFGQWFGYVSKSQQIPTNAVYFTAVMSCLLSLLVFGPSTVLNGVFGAGSICFFFSYGIPIWLLMFGGRKKLPQKRYCNLGKFGLPINILAVAWQFLSVVFLSFPLSRPVTPTNMNWASVCAVVGLAMFFVNWFCYAKHHYTQPKPLHFNREHDA